MAKGLLIIKTLTPTHPGAGASVGAIDLMLQREVTTDFPFIQGSSLKGAIRGYLEVKPVKGNDNLVQDLINELENYANRKNDKNLKEEVEKVKKESGSLELPVFKAREFTEILVSSQEDEKSMKEVRRRFSPLYSKYDKVFGPYNPGGDLKRGALIISDASLLFYPVRSLKGLYAFVTCPEILRRLKMPHIGFGIPEELLEWDEKEKVFSLGANLNNFKIGNRVYFEDLNFDVETKDLSLSWIDNLQIDEKDKARLFLVHDDVFQYFVKFATMVISRNKIDYTTGTVDKKIGGLWTEEHLPPETYLFSYLEDDGKPVDGSQTAFNWLENQFTSSKTIHLGGDETVGKGFVELRFKDL